MGARRASARLLDALLPPRCLACAAEVTDQGTLCADCFAALAPVTAPFCERCGVPFAHAGQGPPAPGALLCATCETGSPVFRTARAALRYGDGAKRLILPFKHGDRTDLAWPLARQMARAGAPLLARAEIIVPVPAHWRRLVGRRYDQAALLARALGAIAGRPVVPDMLRRSRATPPLGDKRAMERALAVAGAFAVSRRAAVRLVGRQVLLVDDVMTSGATVNACASALLAGGAAAVDVLAVARVPDPRLGVA
ncbi:double zinc ribbon domain-containing protein [Roseomonas sp. CAU 1739]|uniref:double zinc ribbon domain-containing protein n=1 Tax=Roseomonas sp. CAU 1739 TaxID=3140364 RepID=UPI00325C1505